MSGYSINFLIYINKAMLLTDAEEIIEIMGWEEKVQKSKAKSQKELFIELSKEEKLIVDILNEKESVHIDELNIKSGLSSSSAAAAILSLELQNVIISLPGKLYTSLTPSKGAGGMGTRKPKYQLPNRGMLCRNAFRK